LIRGLGLGVLEIIEPRQAGTKSQTLVNTLSLWCLALAFHFSLPGDKI